MSMISSKAAAAREGARRPDGRFGEQHLGEVGFEEGATEFPSTGTFEAIAYSEECDEVRGITDLRLAAADQQGQEYWITRSVSLAEDGALLVTTIAGSGREQVLISEEKLSAEDDGAYQRLVDLERERDWSDDVAVAYKRLQVPPSIHPYEHSPQQVCGWLNAPDKDRAPWMVRGATLPCQDGLEPNQAMIGDRLYEEMNGHWWEAGDPYGEAMELPQGVELDEDFPPGAKTHACRWHGDYFWEKATYADGSTFTKRSGPKAQDAEHYTPTDDGWRRTRIRKLPDVTMTRRSVASPNQRNSEVVVTPRRGEIIAASAEQLRLGHGVLGSARCGEVRTRGVWAPGESAPMVVTTPNGELVPYDVDFDDVDTPEALTHQMALAVAACFEDNPLSGWLAV